jgi:hypothetical protein
MRAILLARATVTSIFRCEPSIVPGVEIPARAGEWMSDASYGTIAIILGDDLVSRERADAARSRVRGFGKTRADLLAPNGNSAISDHFGNLNAYSRCSFAADSQEESFLVNFRLYSSLTFRRGPSWEHICRRFCRH